MKDKYKIFIIGGDYDILNKIYQTYAKTNKTSYATLYDLWAKYGNTIPDSYSYYLDKLGHSSFCCVVNNSRLQFQWVKENAKFYYFFLMLFKIYDSVIKRIPIARKVLIKKWYWQYKIVDMQVKKFKPDIILSFHSSQNINILKKWTRKYFIILQSANANTLKSEILHYFDLILSSSLEHVSATKSMGLNAKYFKSGFDPRNLKKLDKNKTANDVIFIGGLSKDHKKRIKLLEYVAEHISTIKIFGHGLDSLNKNSPIRKKHHGKKYGIEMLNEVYNSKIVINSHIDCAGEHSGNNRMYETTGAGSLLLTDKKNNNNELFITNKEIVEYQTFQECVNKINYYLQHNDAREEIAKAGQQKTLTTHTIMKRMEELIQIIDQMIHNKKRILKNES